MSAIQRVPGNSRSRLPLMRLAVSLLLLAQVHDLGATPYIPFKSNSVSGEPGTVWEKMYHFFAMNRENFEQRYHQRSNVESAFSMIKAKFGDAVRSKTDVAMKNEVLCKILAHMIRQRSTTGQSTLRLLQIERAIGS